MFCIIGVYEVSHSIVDVWIMLIMGIIGYGLRKFGFDPAPLVLGLVIAPTLEMSLRQSLIMSNGNWAIFLQRPISLVLLVVCAALMIHGVPPGPTLVNEHPNIFWGFVASMYVGNLMLLALNLPLVGIPPTITSRREDLLSDQSASFGSTRSVAHAHAHRRSFSSPR